MSFTIAMTKIGDVALSTASTPATASSEPTLLMLHGVTRRWQTFLPVTAALAQRCRLMLVDLRGHGESDRATGGYRVVNYVDDICELIHACIPGPLMIYGHSLGAMTAAGVAARLGEHVSALVMEDPPLQTMGTRIGETSLLSYFTQVGKFAGSRLPVDVMARELADTTYQDPATGTSLRIGDTRDAAQLRFAASSLKRLDPAVLEPILTSTWLEGFSVDDVFQALKCPALILHADEAAGGMLTRADAEYVLALNDRVLRVAFPGAPHGIHWTATQPLLNVVLPFLESVR
ncbi:MAG: alpha/beta hydrolase [Planctomycetaceae bacterium]